MPVYLSPGVFIEEIPAGPKPISGVPTSTAAFVGRTERGDFADPKRLASWNDYLVQFGGFIEDSFTADSVFGFFQNGGTACFVSRADEGEPALWSVLDRQGIEIFKIEASSAGAWANDVRVEVSRATTDKGAKVFARKVTDLADIGTAASILTVSDTVGIAANDKIGIQEKNLSEVDATVTAVTATTLTIVPKLAPLPADGDTWVYLKVDAAAERLPLSEGKGFAKGDGIKVVIPGSEDRPTAFVTAFTKTNSEKELDLKPASLSGNFPGAVFARKMTAYAATLKATTVNVTEVLPNQLNWAQEDLKPKLPLVKGDYLVGSGGWEAIKPASGGFPISDKDAKGALNIYAGLTLVRFQPTLASPEDGSAVLGVLSGLYGWMPEGTILEITEVGAAASVKAIMDSGVIVTPTGGTAPDTTKDYDSVSLFFDGTDLTGAGLLMRSLVEPEVGDFVKLGAKFSQIKAVTAKIDVADLYHLTFEDNFPPVVLPDTAAAVPGDKFIVNAWQKSRVVAQRFNLKATHIVNGEEIAVEVFESLSMGEEHLNYYFKEDIVNDESQLIKVRKATGTNAANLPVTSPTEVAGSDGALIPKNYRKAINALDAEAEPAIIAVPDAHKMVESVHAINVMKAAIGHAEKMRRFAILDFPDDDDDKLIDFRNDHLDSTYAAGYAPWVKIINPLRNALTLLRKVPPSGFVAGVYARTDQSRGVYKAPANEPVRGVSQLARKHTTSQQDALNPLSINLIRAFPGRGIRVWGARNLTDDTQWRYVNVRRLFLFIENSIDRGTQWTVFEPNNEDTWLRVRVTVENFLNTIWRAGGLAGTSPEEAYRVRIGLGQTMTETDINLGRMIIEIGVAATRPAEFVIFRISHKLRSES